MNREEQFERGRDYETGAESKRWVEVMRFIVFGTLNTAIAYTLYLGLLRLVPYPAAYTGSYVLGIFISYWLNAQFVFREKLRLRAATAYPAVYVIQYLFSMAMLYLLVQLCGVSEVVAPFIVAVCAIPLTYLMGRFIIKGGRSGAGIGTPDQATNTPRT